MGIGGTGRPTLDGVARHARESERSKEKARGGERMEKMGARAVKVMAKTTERQEIKQMQR
jgi:hypothetical protein